MSEWVYKSTEAKVDRVRTLTLAKRRSFLCRSAFSEDGKWIPYVRDVRVDDLVHFYHRDERRVPRGVGSFRIVGKEGHPFESAIGALIPETALYMVDDPSLITSVDKDGGYQPDDVLGKFTGWLLSQSVGNTPPYDERMFSRQQTLAPYPRAARPARARP